MLILSAKDSNNSINHVATVLAKKENTCNYKFLLESAIRNEDMLRLLTSPLTTIYCDGHKGAPSAIRQVLPMVSFRRCVRHLICGPNMSKIGKVRVVCCNER